MPSSMAFFRELRAPLVALATVALLGAVIMPPQVRTALAALYCAPQITAFDDGSAPDAPAPTHCGLCIAVLAAGPQHLALGQTPRAASVVAPGTQAMAGLVLRQVRNRGPPRFG